MPEQIVQFTITGILTGSIYALVAIGLVTFYNVTGILNLAQGDFVMLGGMIFVSIYKLGLPLLPAAVLSIILIAIIGIFIERTAIYTARNSPIIILISITVGLGIFLHGLALIIWGTSPQSTSSFIGSEPIRIYGAVLPLQGILVIISLLLLLLVLYIFFEKTILGTSLKACMINPEASQLVGINVRNMSMLSFTISAAIGAIGGIIVAPISGITYDMGLMLSVKGFMAMVIGGMTNVFGAVVGGLILGLFESFTAGMISTIYSDAISFVILILFLFLLPNGLFAKSKGKRV
ncbi:branched-chain amino acid ABC transporter permease [Paenibacillus validus]|uniref:branched-chain amino acid ABC transporter permease n=1 Tax=Paenibacillus validus TaxID=44253 RepID=UPI000FDCAA9C|nr:branched-chain amino acid ABC transporter permease [Paenibacillus validus]MED4602198.1 branched-chain amino acid ABC transporter permease [Paenibacillus validus]MED4607495.1 branched-chain amino acid ABC transporter permease [Paenibacillus validus]